MNGVGLQTSLLWRVRLFDGPILQDTLGHEIRRFRSRRVGALLAYLALNLDRPCSRELLTVLLWPDEDDGDALSNRMRVTIASLRRQLEPSGIPFGSVLDVSVPGLIRLRADTVWCDADAAERAISETRIDEAARLITGDLLPGYYDEWAVEVRNRFSAIKAELPDAVQPLPGPRLPQRDIADETCRRLPLYLTRFFGREVEQERVCELIAQNRLVTITGSGGTGKTRLAVEAVRRLHWAMTFVPLAGLTDADRLPETILKSLSIVPQVRMDPVEQLATALRPHEPIVLIVDNAEQLVPEVCPLVSRLLSLTENVRLLVTSRRRLEIDGEVIFNLAPLESPRHASSPERLLEFPAVALFLDRVRNVRPDFAAGPRQVGPLVEICTRLEGVPLALELAAARAATQSLTQISSGLASSLLSLSTRQHGFADRHRSLRAAVQGSYDLLSPEERRFFLALSIFQGGWTAEAARAVTGEPRTDEMLADLVSRSLIQVQEDEAVDGVRFTLLDTFREFADEIVQEVGHSGSGQAVEGKQFSLTRREVTGRHADYFLSLAERAAPEIASTGSSEMLDLLDREQENLRTSFVHMIERRDLPGAKRLAVALSGFWAIRGYLAEGRRSFEALDQLAEGAAIQTRADILYWCGVFAIRQNDFQEARRYITSSRLLYEEAGDRRGIMRCEQSMGDALRLVGDLSSAIERYHVCLSIGEEIGEQIDLARCHHGMGVVAIYSGEYEMARDHLNRALEIRRGLHNPLEVARTQNLLAFAITELGDLEEAQRLFDISLTAFIGHGDRWYHASTLYGLAQIQVHLGTLQNALEEMEASLRIMRELGSHESVGNLLTNVAHLREAMGRRDTAAAATLEALEIGSRIGADQLVAQALTAAALLCSSAAHADEAAQILSASRAAYEKVGMRPSLMVHAVLRRAEANLVAFLGPGRFEEATAAGNKMDKEQAVGKAIRLLNEAEYILRPTHLTEHRPPGPVP